MIYACPHCTASFNAKKLRAAIENGDRTIICEYCGNLSELNNVQASHSTKGYEHLVIGDFYEATIEFASAMRDAESHGFTPSVDTYIGYALAQFRVQTIFSDENPEEPPQLVCHHCNEAYFVDSAEYQKAYSSARGIGDTETITKIQSYANTIDSIKDHYDSKPKNFDYGVFIAYEDKSKDSDDGYRVASRVRNLVPDGVKNVFLPDIEEFNDDELVYEAEILYAIDHSKCMLVITDNDMDDRLINMYARYYLNPKNRGGLGFVRYCDKITISLPDHKIASNIFDIDDAEGFKNFIRRRNNLLESIEIAEGKSDEPAVQNGGMDNINEPAGGNITKAPYTFSDTGNQILMGSYPQSKCNLIAVNEHFKALPKPNGASDNGWIPMFKTADGKPYTWYRDEDVEAEVDVIERDQSGRYVTKRKNLVRRYRGVYFLKYRKVYSIRDNNIPPTTQKMAGYVPAKLHVFSFDPIIWNIMEMTMGSAVLLASTGLDSREYNDLTYDNEWEGASIRHWLNNEFFETAFTDEQKEVMFGSYINGTDELEKVFLMDEDFDKKGYNETSNAIVGSDYFKCLGGAVTPGRVVNSYWIKPNYNHVSDGKATAVFPATSNKLSAQPVDSTMVSVVPKIKIRLADVCEG